MMVVYVYVVALQTWKIALHETRLWCVGYSDINSSSINTNVTDIQSLDCTSVNGFWLDGNMIYGLHHFPKGILNDNLNAGNIKLKDKVFKIITLIHSCQYAIFQICVGMKYLESTTNQLTNMPNKFGFKLHIWAFSDVRRKFQNGNDWTTEKRKSVCVYCIASSR